MRVKYGFSLLLNHVVVPQKFHMIFGEKAAYQAHSFRGSDNRRTRAANKE